MNDDVARPTVGRIVHYCGGRDPGSPGGSVAAIVTGIAQDGSLWLHVMPPGAPALDAAGVFQIGHQPERERGRPYWIWPPRE